LGFLVDTSVLIELERADAPLALSFGEKRSTWPQYPPQSYFTECIAPTVNVRDFHAIADLRVQRWPQAQPKEP
jgi:predicted nucleic acid-binding protein